MNPIYIPTYYRNHVVTTPFDTMKLLPCYHRGRKQPVFKNKLLFCTYTVFKISNPSKFLVTNTIIVTISDI